MKFSSEPCDTTEALSSCHLDSFNPFNPTSGCGTLMGTQFNVAHTTPLHCRFRCAPWQSPGDPASGLFLKPSTRCGQVNLWYQTR